MKKSIINGSGFLAGLLAASIFTGCGSKTDVLKLNTEKYTERILTVNGSEFTVRCYENVLYAANPADSKREVMNIYVPKEYFEGKSVNGWTSETAPIFLPNQIGGYMPGDAGKPDDGTNPVPGAFRFQDGPNSIAVALSKGLVVASPAARGRTEKYGHAPACIVDLKAAVRYLRHNRKVLPGDTEKIISNGTSAGGALSALLGASGNSKDYEKYLKQIGAAKERDDIFAVSAYCPITNLENANAAYEWFFNGQKDYAKMDMKMIDYHMERKLVHGTLTDDEKALSDELKKQFVPYVNSLNLKDDNGNLLTLDEDGHGTFEDYIKSLIISSAQKALDEGSSFEGKDWITVKDNRITDIDLEAYKAYLGRQKLPGAFDSLKNDTGENNLFGDDTDTFKHFTEYAFEHSLVNGKLCDQSLVKIMNAMNYIQNTDSKTAANWRIRAGTKDSDTAPCISAMLALKLKESGKNVNYCLPWDVTHSGDYDLPELFDWIEEICR